MEEQAGKLRASRDCGQENLICYFELCWWRVWRPGRCPGS
jgi:hypothetical protein